MASSDNVSVSKPGVEVPPLSATLGAENVAPEPEMTEAERQQREAEASKALDSIHQLQEQLGAVHTRATILQKELESLKAEEEALNVKLDAANALYALRKGGATGGDGDASTKTVVEAASEQAGCRFLQRRLEESDAPERAILTKQILENCVELSCNPFGNFLVQKLLELAPDDVLMKFLVAIEGELADIATSMQGCRVLQKLIDVLRTDEQHRLFILTVSGSLVSLAKDLNGTYVVQKILHKIPHAAKMPVIDIILENYYELACNRQGCCVVQRCIEHSPEDKRDELLKKLFSSILKLVQDPFGNYVAQFLVSMGNEQVTNQVIRHLLHNIATLACNKFASNVIEKSIKAATTEIRQLIVDEITEPHVVSQLMQDSFANYVIQTALNAASEEQFRQLADAIRPQLHLVRNSPFGKRIESRITRNQASRQKNRDGRPKMNPRESAPAGPRPKRPHGMQQYQQLVQSQQPQLAMPPQQQQQHHEQQQDDGLKFTHRIPPQQQQQQQQHHHPQQQQALHHPQHHAMPAPSMPMMPAGMQVPGMQQAQQQLFGHPSGGMLPMGMMPTPTQQSMRRLEWTDEQASDNPYDPMRHQMHALRQQQYPPQDKGAHLDPTLHSRK